MPIYAVNESMKIVFCNQALCDWTGLTDEELTDLTCVWQTVTDQPPSRQIAAGLCPPPDSFRGFPCGGWVSLPEATKRKAEFRQVTFVPANQIGEAASNAEGKGGGVVVFVYGTARASNQLDADVATELVESSGVSNASFDPARLHIQIASMQFESAASISIDRIVGSSPAAKKVRQQVAIASEVAANVLIVGPRGSGRKSIAPLIHYANGYEAAGALVSLQCSVCDLESLQDTIKSLYRSQKQHSDEPFGRLLLHDVDALSPEAQDELLGFLQLPDFGLNCFATASLTAGSKLKPALWQALSTMVIELPKLADRREDVPLIVQAVVEQFNESGRTQRHGVDPQAMAQLVRYGWPGELEELIEVVDRAASQATSPLIGMESFPSHVRIAIRAAEQGASSIETESIQLDEFLAEIEEQMIERALKFAGGNKSEAARLLGISRARLLRRLGSGDSSTEIDFQEVSDE